MSRLIRINGIAYRMRRGKLVKIPEEWVGKTVYPRLTFRELKLIGTYFMLLKPQEI